MSVQDSLIPRLQASEGFRTTLYTDTTGHETIGYGWNVQAGITRYQAGALLNAQVSEIILLIQQYWWFAKLDEVRAGVIVEVAFNQGISSLLHYVKMLAAVGAQDWATASAELLDSDAARLLPDRYGKLSHVLATGLP